MPHARRNTVTIETEKVRQIPSLRELTAKNMAGMERVYFGPEFCERLLPDPPQLKRALALARARKVKFSLLTPSVTEHGLRQIRSLVALLRDEDEVVVNDYGVLFMLEQEFGHPVWIGRALGRIVVPALAALRGHDSWFRDYRALLGRRVAGVEVDSFNVPAIDPFLAERMPVAFFAGLPVWTTTRRCAFNVRARRLHKFCLCRKECLRAGAVIENVAAGKKLLLHGNAILEPDQAAPELNNGLLFKRVIYDAQ